MIIYIYVYYCLLFTPETQIRTTPGSQYDIIRYERSDFSTKIYHPDIQYLVKNNPMINDDCSIHTIQYYLYIGTLLLYVLRRRSRYHLLEDRWLWWSVVGGGRWRGKIL